MHAQYELTLPMRNLTEMFYARDKCSRFHTAWARSGETISAPMSAIEVLTGLVVLRWSFVGRDPKLSWPACLKTAPSKRSPGCGRRLRVVLSCSRCSG